MNFMNGELCSSLLFYSSNALTMFPPFIVSRSCFGHGYLFQSLAKHDYGKMKIIPLGNTMKFGLKIWSLFQSLTGDVFVTPEKSFTQS
jgi:hypothetical protein